jgi:16S rRNA (guanine(966)-N(2))-methyltransferase RsmD
MIELRVLSGIFKGRRIKVPRRQDAALSQFTKECVRKALFDILAGNVKNARFLDLFSGSGAIGIEAYSRGAGEVVLVENDPACEKAIRQTLEIFSGDREAPKLFYMHGDVFKVLTRLRAAQKKFDIIFMDPPYGRCDLVKKVLIKVLAYAILTPKSLVIVEHSLRDRVPKAVVHENGCLSATAPRIYGNTALSFYGYTENTAQ